MPTENWWTLGLHVPVQSTNGYTAALSSPDSLLRFKRRVATGCVSCTASIPLILLPAFTTGGVHGSNISLVAAVRSERQPGAGMLSCCTCSAARPSMALFYWRHIWALFPQCPWVFIKDVLANLCLEGRTKTTCVGGKSCMCQQLFCAKLQWFRKESTHLRILSHQHAGKGKLLFEKVKPSSMNTAALKASHMVRNNHYDHSHLVLFTVHAFMPETPGGLLTFLHAIRFNCI